MGIKSVLADSGPNGLTALQRDLDYDLILLDIKMPGMDGFETLKKIRAINPEIKVIAQTAYAMKSDENKIRRAGFDGDLAKPFKFEILASAVNTPLAPSV